MKCLCLFFLLILNLSCDTGRTSKAYSFIVSRDGSFLKIGLKVDPSPAGDVYADLTIENKSDSTIPFYKLLLPEGGELKTDIFSIINEESLQRLDFFGIRYGNYIKTAPDDYEGVILPGSKAKDFINLFPHQRLAYRVNLKKYYDFSRVEKGSSLSIRYTPDIPVVSLAYNQVVEKDTLDNLLKPVYYILQADEPLDSVRVYFKR